MLISVKKNRNLPKLIWFFFHPLIITFENINK